MSLVRRCSLYYFLALTSCALLIVDGLLFLWMVNGNMVLQSHSTLIFVASFILAILMLFFERRAHLIYRKLYPTDPYCP